MKDFELGIKPKQGVTPNREMIEKHREAIIWQLVSEYLDDHAGMIEKDNLTLWTAFKAKKKVRLIATNEDVYIHSIQSYIEWETHKVKSGYVICRSKDKDEFKTEYSNGLTICQAEELEVIRR